mmetsp:Transcript_15247/g.29287  ORF Transcript_15247/g.29287 Transcript_15247/m.29287 type:complete len:282 (-) Transcript_15247:294-1139(-)
MAVVDTAVGAFEHDAEEERDASFQHGDVAGVGTAGEIAGHLVGARMHVALRSQTEDIDGGEEPASLGGDAGCGRGTLEAGAGPSLGSLPPLGGSCSFAQSARAPEPLAHRALARAPRPPAPRAAERSPGAAPSCLSAAGCGSTQSLRTALRRRRSRPADWCRTPRPPADCHTAGGTGPAPGAPLPLHSRTPSSTRPPDTLAGNSLASAPDDSAPDFAPLRFSGSCPGWGRTFSAPPETGRRRTPARSSPWAGCHPYLSRRATPPPTAASPSPADRPDPEAA